MTWNKPLPSIDEDNQQFFQALARHEFVLCHCKVCGAWYFPLAYCRNHANEPFFGNMEWVKASGRGKVFAYNVHHQAMHPGFADEIPYALGLIELDEGPMFVTQIVSCDPSEVSIGMPVEVFYKDVPEEGFTLPYFQPSR